MGMSTHLYGIRTYDDESRRLAAVWHACEEAGVPIPAEVEKFFDYEPPEQRGVLVDLEDTDAVSEYRAEMSEGFEVDLTLIPDDIKAIRFVNSW